MKNYNDLVKNRIKAIRNEHKLSQKQVADKAGWSLDTYKNVEKEIKKNGIKINCEHIRDLCNAYKLDSADYFIFGKELDREAQFYFDKQ